MERYLNKLLIFPQEVDALQKWEGENFAGGVESDWEGGFRGSSIELKPVTFKSWERTRRFPLTSAVAHLLQWLIRDVYIIIIIIIMIMRLL